MSQITSHILDTSKGKAVAGVRITLYAGQNDEWTALCSGLTNEDGRVKDLIKSSEPLKVGIYKLRFETKDYFDAHQIPTFYPMIEIIVDIQTTEHYHIPLLLNPFGYSTYRGT